MGHDKDDHGMIEEADDDILPDSVIEALQNQRRSLFVSSNLSVQSSLTVKYTAHRGHRGMSMPPCLS